MCVSFMFHCINSTAFFTTWSVQPTTIRTGSKSYSVHQLFAIYKFPKHNFKKLVSTQVKNFKSANF